jgi:hypothetical protein
MTSSKRVGNSNGKSCGLAPENAVDLNRDAVPEIAVITTSAARFDVLLLHQHGCHAQLRGAPAGDCAEHEALPGQPHDRVRLLLGGKPKRLLQVRGGPHRISPMLDAELRGRSLDVAHLGFNAASTMPRRPLFGRHL